MFSETNNIKNMELNKALIFNTESQKCCFQSFKYKYNNTILESTEKLSEQQENIVGMEEQITILF